MYVPDHDNGAEPHGRWHYSYVSAAQGWTTGRDFRYDYAGIALRPHHEHGMVEGYLGAQGYDFGGGYVFDEVLALSYPQVGYQRDDFTGDDLWYRQGPTTSSLDQVRLTCDMRSGASGSPWLHDFDAETCTGYLVAVHVGSLRGPDGPSGSGAYGAELGDGAINLYNHVTTTCQVTVPDDPYTRGC
ncbi:trypsin-like serine peptidase [Streptomyces bohaiensis]|uniref:trypsin-like serine peptidase n=1 Tax=Streptomyces bohaiensis TaxID=1431344 RepID=UPI003B821E8C